MGTYPRRLVVRTLAGLGSLAGFATLGGAVVRPVAAAAPAVAGPVPTIRFLYNWQGPWNVTAGKLVSEALLQIEPKVGAHIVPLINGCCGGGAGYIIPEILAGTGPDVYTGCCEDFAGFVSQGMLLNLAPYIKRDNINPDIWSSGQFAGFTLPGGQYALPVYAGPHVLMYNQSVLDELGLSYPEDGWDYLAAAKLWSACTATKNGQHRYGAQLSWFNDYWEGPYLVRGWGGQEMNAAHTRCELDSPAAIAAMTWLYEQLDAGVVATRDLSINPWPLGPQTVFVTLWGGTITQTAAALHTTGAKWRYIPYPKWPVRHASDMNIDFYGISGYTRYPEQAWALLKEISGPGTSYQRNVQMRVALTPPCLNSLWEEFLSIAYTVAPPLRGRNLEAMMHTALNGWGYTQQYYTYEPVQADGILANYLDQLAQKAVTPAEAMAQAAKQVNAMEATGARVQVQAARTLASAQADAAAGRPVTAPAATGEGLAPSTAARGFFSKTATGTYTLVGDGADVWSPTTNCLFAGTASVAEQADFVCRVTTLSNVDCPHLSQWVKVGLMAAGDLSDAAAAVTIEATGENGVYLQLHPYAGGSWSSTGPTTPTAASGLIGAKNLTLPNSKPLPNYLVRPVWLRLSRRGLVWTAYTSSDGTTWTAAGSPSGIEMGGAWVGLFATSHNSSFGGKGTIRVSFDQVSFPVTDVYQIGTP